MNDTTGVCRRCRDVADGVGGGGAGDALVVVDDDFAFFVEDGGGEAGGGGGAAGGDEEEVDGSCGSVAEDDLGFAVGGLLRVFETQVVLDFDAHAFEHFLCSCSDGWP